MFEPHSKPYVFQSNQVCQYESVTGNYGMDLSIFPAR